MSNYCEHCRFDPAKRTGSDACPFTVLYWDFLARHEGSLKKNQRMSFQMMNLNRLADSEREEIRATADSIRKKLKQDSWLHVWIFLNAFWRNCPVPISNISALQRQCFIKNWYPGEGFRFAALHSSTASDWGNVDTQIQKIRSCGSKGNREWLH